MLLLFICEGNICRSPTAERLALVINARSQVPNLTTSSAGIRAVIGHPIHRDAAAVIEKLGGDATNFAARQLTPKIAAAADLVLTMTKAQRDTFLETAPRQLRRTFTLNEAAQLISGLGARDLKELAALRPLLRAEKILDIPDPIGQNPGFFAQVGDQIADCLHPILSVCRGASDLIS